jgi:DMSO/TMAO reductase YedYZ molybdopterin-dependent catalytic subunit
MNRATWGLAAVIVAVGAAAVVGTASGDTTPPSAPAGAATFTVSGKVTTTLPWTTADLARLPQHVQLVAFQSKSGWEWHIERGPLLVDVIDAAGPVSDPSVKNDLLRDYVSATGADGYRAIVSWGEIDPDFGHKQVLLATSEDGKSLAATGPRLVVPGDIKGGRYVSTVRDIHLASADDEG